MDSSAAVGLYAAAAVAGLIGLVVGLISLVSIWKVFTKAGKPGWAAIVPIYNMVVLLEIVGKPLWWIALMFVPFANFVVTVLIYVELAKVFGKGVGFAIGLLLFGPIFFAILAFGSATYQRPAPMALMPAY